MCPIVMVLRILEVLHEVVHEYFPCLNQIKSKIQGTLSSIFINKVPPCDCCCFLFLM